jgi:hypothetical protein
MRIWSLHPKYLDKKGLLALWREALLAKQVLEGKTKGYKNHPQLDRFKKAKNPADCINKYLATVYRESVKRGYNFAHDKIKWNFKCVTMTVKRGQLNYEKTHLLNKLKTRDIARYKELNEKEKIETHPLFKVVEGEIEEWEIIGDKKSVSG